MVEQYDSTATEALLTELKRVEAEYKLGMQMVDYYSKLRARLTTQVHATCDHTWGSPVAGYEHEGLNCIICGVNNQHLTFVKHAWEHLKTQPAPSPV